MRFVLVLGIFLKNRQKFKFQEANLIGNQNLAVDLIVIRVKIDKNMP